MSTFHISCNKTKCLKVIKTVFEIRCECPYFLILTVNVFGAAFKG